MIRQISKAIPMPIEIQKATVLPFENSLKIRCAITVNLRYLPGKIKPRLHFLYAPRRRQIERFIIDNQYTVILGNRSEFPET
jgi:hypothetical protein